MLFQTRNVSLYSCMIVTSWKKHSAPESRVPAHKGLLGVTFHWRSRAVNFSFWTESSSMLVFFFFFFHQIEQN